MKRIVVTLAVAGLITATAAVPAFANGRGGPPRGGGVAEALFWPVAAALTIPAAIIGTVAHATLPPHAGPQAPVRIFEGPAEFAGPRAYYAPSGPELRREHYQQREHHEPRGYYDRECGPDGAPW